jgi:hypothetical protein
MCPCNSTYNVVPTCTLFLPGGEVFNEAEPCNIPVKAPAKTKTQVQPCRKRPLRRYLAFNQFEVTAIGSVDYPRVRHTPRKSRPRVQPDKYNKCVIRSLLLKYTSYKSRLRVQPDKHNKCAIRSLLPKDTLCKSRLRVQPDKHNKCAIRSLLLKDTPRKIRLRVQPDKHNKCAIRSLSLKEGQHATL